MQLPICRKREILWRERNNSLRCIYDQRGLPLSLLEAAPLSFLLSLSGSHLSFLAPMCSVTCCFYKVQIRMLTRVWGPLKHICGQNSWNTPVSIHRLKFHDISNPISNTICLWMAHYWIMRLSFITVRALLQYMAITWVALHTVYCAVITPLQICTVIMEKEWRHRRWVRNEMT